MRLIALALLAASTALLPGCDDDPTSTPDDASRPDATPDMASEVLPDAMLDAMSPPVTDASPDAIPDAIADMASDATPDAMPEPARCSAPPPAPLAPDGPLPDAVGQHPGIDPLEADAWQTLRAGLLAAPSVHFVVTYDHAADAYVVDGGPPDARSRLVARRVHHADHTALEVVEGSVEAIWPSTDPARYPDYAALLDALENPEGVTVPDRGYAPDDPRVGWLPLEAQSWPDPLLRLTTLFDGADAPDVAVGLWPWAYGGTGTHGGLGLLQSQATFVVSGKGARRGVVLDTPARLVDAAPTVLAALGSRTTGGVGPDGTYADGLYLTRQDGEVRWEALDPDPCERPKHVVMVLFDGLLAAEANHLMQTDEGPALPTLRAMARDGAIFRHGAVVGFPSLSAPGHTTAGTGAWPGRHGVVGNAFYGRADGAVINPFAVLSDLPTFFGEPARFYALYDRIVTGDVETLSQALDRGLDGGAFTAVLNELTIGGADYDPLHHFGLGGPKASVEFNERLDALGEVMALSLLGDGRHPVPDLLQIAFVATDSAGENDGPHSPLLRATLATIDGRLAAVREAYARRGALDDTMFVLVSDHGMELVDPTRRGPLDAIIRETGVRTRFVGSGGIWLATLAVARAPAADGVALTVTAHDDGAPIEGATARCEGCDPAVEATTDADGRALLPISDDMAPDAIIVSHPNFNARRLEWDR